MKTSVLIVALLLILAAGGIYFFWNNSGNEMPNQTLEEDNANQASAGEQTSSGGTNSESKDVEISGFSFSPSTLTISVGDSVIWTNMDSATHTITSDSGNELDSETFSNGNSYSHTFTTAGTYAYHCNIHTSMKGTIVVE